MDCTDLQIYLMGKIFLDIPIDIIDLIINYYNKIGEYIITSFVQDITSPIVYDFHISQDIEKREKMISELPNDVMNAICTSLNIILSKYKVNINPCNVKKYMQSDSAEYYRPIAQEYSRYWCLMKFQGEFGTIYNFTGWPCDVQTGIGLLQLPWNFSDSMEDNFVEIYKYEDDYDNGDYDSDGNIDLVRYIVSNVLDVKIIDRFWRKINSYAKLQMIDSYNLKKRDYSCYLNNI